jgi:hypothetical protein
MPFLLLLGLLALSFNAAADYDAGGQNTQGADVDASKLDPATKARIRTEGSVGGLGNASGGASGDAARSRAGANASTEGGASLGATGVNTRPATKAEEAEKRERRELKKKK